jgi:hypothetical protein
MLTQLLSVKTRLGLSEFEVKDDGILSNAINALSTRFDQHCNRQFARAVDAMEEFSAAQTQLAVAAYPLESVNKFELKTLENGGWLELSGVEYIIRRNCVISLYSQLGARREQLRVTYTGGYVLPGDVAAPGQTPLPNDVEQAVVEQVAYWFQNRERLGVIRQWPRGGTYEQFVNLDLLPSVESILKTYQRCPW